MSGARYSFGDFELLTDRQVLLYAGAPLRLGARAFGILAVLAQADGDYVAKDVLLAKVWPGLFVEEANLRVHVGALRRLLGEGKDGVAIANAPGRGYRLLGDIRRGEASSSPSAAPGPARTPSTRLIGRDEDLRHTLDLLGQARVVTLVGPGGIGKTSLAQAAAEHWSQVNAMPFVAIDLTPLSGADAIWRAALNALGQAESADPRRSVIDRLGQTPTLILLDNCEHVLEAAVGFVETIASASVTVLATSREALRASGEHVRRLDPLTYPLDNELESAAALTYPAVALLVERIAALQDGYVLKAEETRAAIEICRRLDGSPLALELAAARTDLFSLRQLAARLDDRFQILTRGRRSALPRHQTLQATLDWSYRLLAPTEQRLLRRLSVFPNPFGLEAAEAVAWRDEPEPHLFLEALSNLVAKSMLSVDIGGDAPIYRLLETTRAFAAAELAGTDEVDAVQVAHGRWLLSLLQECASPDGQAAWLGRCMAARDGVGAALAWSLQRDPQLGAELALAAFPVWMETSQMTEEVETFRRALAIAVTAEDGAAERVFRVGVGLSSYYRNGPSAEILNHLERALALHADAGDSTTALSVLWMLYGISANWGDYPGARRHALDFAARIGAATDTGSWRKGQRIVARSLHDLGQHEAAWRHLEPILGSSPPIDAARPSAYEIDDDVAAHALAARLAWIRGLDHEAQSFARLALDRAQTLDHGQTTAWSITFNLLPLAIWSGDLVQAKTLSLIARTAAARTFPHWLQWTDLYDQVIELLLDPEGVPTPDLRDALPAQIDLLATFHPRLVHPRAIARAKSAPETWCAPEILRASAEQLIARHPDTGLDQARALVHRAEALAQRQGAFAWALRAGDMLGRLPGASVSVVSSHNDWGPDGVGWDRLLDEKRGVKDRCKDH